jgi:hypothetical protein
MTLSTGMHRAGWNRVALPMLIIGALDSVEEQLVRGFADLGIPCVPSVCEAA